MIYFYSDLHFGQPNLLKFERFCFSTIEEHDETIIKSLEKLGEGDTLWFLGDIGYPSEEIKNRIRNLRCKTFMVAGNHDKRSADYYKKEYNFDEVYKHSVWIEKRIVLSHIPIPVEDSVINIHGHLHGSFIDKPNYVNVSVHVINYKLYPMKKIMDLMGKLPVSNYKFLEEWYYGIQKVLEEQRVRRNDLIIDEKGIIRGRVPMEK